MKKINSLLLALLGASSLTWTACTESVDYLAAGAVEGEGVYFSNSDPTTINLDATEGSFTVNVYRSNTGAATQASVTSEFSEGAASLFTAPASVDFAEGSAVAAFTVAYSGIERGTKYTMTLSIADGTPYGESSQTYTVVFPEDEGNWEVVSKEAVYTDNLFSMYGVSNFKITGVTVEKNADSNQYRFKSPYTNSYFQTVYDMSLFGANFDAPYIILDGEKFKNEAPGKYYIAPTALGFQMVNGEGPKADDSWNTFGSIAGNLSTADGPIPPTSADYPLVSYDETTKKFDFGSVYHNLGGYGYYILEGFTLYLDPDLMTVDYDRDYTWYEVYQGAGTFTTTVVGEPQSWDQAIQRSEEDPTFYRLPSLYTSNNALYFNLDEESGLLVLPKSQKTGLTTNIGSQEIYMSGVPGKCTYDAATKTFNLQLSLHLVDADGNTTAELAQVAETFVWGNGVFKDFATGKKMSDYQGSWNVPFYGMDGSTVSVPVTTSILKLENGAEYLLASGLSGLSSEEYDDRVQLYYDSESGYVVFFAQTMPNLGEMQVGAYPFDSQNKYYSDSAELVGGLTADGDLKFVSSLMNDGLYDSMIFLGFTEQSVGLLTGYWSGLDWTAATASAAFTKSAVSGISFETGFTKFVNKGDAPTQRRTYLKTLNLSPSVNSSTISTTIQVKGDETKFFLVK